MVSVLVNIPDTGVSKLITATSFAAFAAIWNTPAIFFLPLDITSLTNQNFLSLAGSTSILL